MIKSAWERRLGECKSPIEVRFLNAFCRLAIEHGYDLTPNSMARDGRLIVKTQAPIGSYYADFLISLPFFGEALAVVVECDGKEFHGTKKQIAYDLRRDRFMQKRGIKVYRFAGTDINSWPAMCAMDVLDEVMSFQSAVIVKAMGAAA